ncbi:hypothetical protein LMC10_02430 [Limosilactobacillus reuteri]|uniref:hypothetical protein n=1 Tax=Limosilactobacillus reuteri TaxID=1598 RepID=UPI001E5BE655|nr:hypothetical protein [Limosilactobacillus reuteri]MCC4398948.1 hypothetical protein [Limosilactobacillus reuteri]MCC4402973.1 hypothetical protein [Limosilactobacillus reuteri]
MVRVGSFYRGKLVLPSVWRPQLKDSSFRVRNKDKGHPTVLAYVYSDRVYKDRQAYVPCMALYHDYQAYCKEQSLKPLSSWQFKRNMQVLGFVWQRCHSFYRGYGSYYVTTAYKNICFDHRKNRRYHKHQPSAKDFIKE